MDVGYYYQILETGVLYEKGRKNGKRWKIGERKRLIEEVLFWQTLLDFISLEKRGVECSEKLFVSLGSLCKKYKFPNYERILEMKDQLINNTYIFERKQEEELKIYNLMNRLIKDMQKELCMYKDKETFYHILAVIHNLPKAMHGRNVLNKNCNSISYSDALLYTKEYMDEKMKEDYKEFLD